MKQENGNLMPEVGQIWETPFALYYITAVFPITEVVNYVSMEDCQVKHRCGSMDIGYLTKKGKYIGRAKHPLSTIFEVEL